MRTGTHPQRRRGRPIGRRDYERALICLRHALHEGDEDRLRCVAATVCSYEQRMGLHQAADAVEAIKMRMEQLGLRQKDLVPLLGSPSRVSEVLSGVRRLTVRMIDRLHVGLGIPFDVLVESSRRAAR